MTRLEVIVLKKFFILQVPVLGLERVELIAQSKIVLVSLLNLKNLGLQLRNEQVFLVTRQVHAIVVLNQMTMIKNLENEKQCSKRNLLGT